jgi:soluble lytic murein transglycosylase
MSYFLEATLSDKLVAVVRARWSTLFVPLLACASLLLPSPLPVRAQTDSSTSSTAKPQTKAASTRQKSSAKTPKTVTKTSGGKSKKAKKKRKVSLRARRVHRAFVASASLRPMARQLLQDRTPAAYAGVESYARRHSNEDAGSLAWLVVGYAHILDHDYAKAIDPLKRAKAHAGDLGEYVAYYLGTAYGQTGRVSEALATLNNFGQNYPDSLLTRDADVAYANLLMGESRAQEAIVLLEKDRTPVRSDIEWTLGHAYEAAGEPGKAYAIFRNLYLTMPLTAEAELAGNEMSKLASAAQGSPVTVEERRARADLLAKGKRWSDAAREYQALVDQVAPGDRASLQLALAQAWQKSGRGKDAKQLLDSLQVTDELNAQRLFLLGEVARGSDDEGAFLNNLAQIRQLAPNSPWLEQALLSAGNIHLLKRDYDKAIDAYRELQQRFPNGNRASYAHWKAAWLTLRQGRTEEAKKAFEEQIAWYPSSNEIPAALYWRGRLAADDKDAAMARAYYKKLSDRFRNYYYADLARKELKKLPESGETPQYALLDRIPPIDLKPSLADDDDTPTDNLRYQKAQLLGNGALIDLAARELQAAANEEQGSWAAPETAHLFQENDRYDRGIEIMKRAVPNYFAMDIPALPRAYWEALFPRPYWTDLKRYSMRNDLDPFLVASLIRQESEFNATAVSHANAVGLMQLLPVTGKKVAKEEKIRHFNASQLFVPGVNLQLGTRYFKAMVDKFGSFEYALAAYNAGSDRVEDWLAAGNYRDPQEFVESIPFTETREYVQAILRNANVYRQLYGNP